MDMHAPEALGVRRNGMAFDTQIAQGYRHDTGLVASPKIKWGHTPFLSHLRFVLV